MRFTRVRWSWLVIAALLGAALPAAHLLREIGVARAAPPATPAERPGVTQLIGLDRAAQQLGDRLPTGQDIRVAHVEAGGDYLPNTRADAFAGVTLTPRSGDSKISGHADSTARIIYGSGGLAPGIQNVDCYSATHFLGAGVLNAGAPTPPDAHGNRLFSHSWVNDQDSRYNTDILRRVDELIDREGVVMCVGVNNGKTNRVPIVLASAYNVIAVGQYEGNSSGGYTIFDGTGRSSPHLVAPGSMTSNSTPVVTAIAARLLEAAQGLGAESHAERPEVIKAVLLAGAEKPEGWKPAPGKALDEHFGAGRVRVDHALAILVAPRDAVPAPVIRIEKPATSTAPAATAPDTNTAPPVAKPLPPGGWTYQPIDRAARHEYTLRLDRPAAVSIVLYWHRRVKGGVERDPFTRQVRWNNIDRLTSMDLALTRAAAVDPSTSTVASSIAPGDNLRHIYTANLPAGEYQLVVTRGDDMIESWNYALAWRCDAVK